MNDVVQQSVEALRGGKTILYPTDTIWGVGCDARNHAAVEKLYALKERDHSKSMLILCVPEILAPNALHVAPYLFSPTERPTTYIIPHEVWGQVIPMCLADNLSAYDGSLGVRLPQHEFCRQLIMCLGAPVVSTSANLSGRPSPKCYDEIEPALKSRVEYCVPALPQFLSGESAGSRIVRVGEDGKFTVLRG